MIQTSSQTFNGVFRIAVFTYTFTNIRVKAPWSNRILIMFTNDDYYSKHAYRPYK